MLLFSCFVVFPCYCCCCFASSPHFPFDETCGRRQCGLGKRGQDDHRTTDWDVRASPDDGDHDALFSFFDLIHSSSNSAFLYLAHCSTKIKQKQQDKGCDGVQRWIKVVMVFKYGLPEMFLRPKSKSSNSVWTNSPAVSWWGGGSWGLLWGWSWGWLGCLSLNNLQCMSIVECTDHTATLAISTSLQSHRCPSRSSLGTL